MMVGPVLFGTMASQAGLGSAFWSGGIVSVGLILGCYALTSGASLPQASTALEQEPAVVE